MRKKINIKQNQAKKKQAELNPDYHAEYSVNNTNDVDGSWSSESVFGKVSYDGTGDVKAQLGDIAGISLGNISALSSYIIDDGPIAISHNIKFRNGGSCRLTYRKTGEIIEFRVKGVKVSMTVERIIIIYPL